MNTKMDTGHGAIIPTVWNVVNLQAQAIETVRNCHDSAPHYALGKARKDSSRPDQILWIQGLSPQRWVSGPFKNFSRIENIAKHCKVLEEIKGLDMSSRNNILGCTNCSLGLLGPFRSKTVSNRGTVLAPSTDRRLV
jgi:hypothetical protein